MRGEGEEEEARSEPMQPVFIREERVRIIDQSKI